MTSDTAYHASRDPNPASVAALCQAANALAQACLLLLGNAPSAEVLSGSDEIRPTNVIFGENLAPIRERQTSPRHMENRTGSRIVSVYCAGTAGLADLARKVGRPLFKLGTTTSAVRTRLEELNAMAYGSLRQTPNGLVSEDGFDMWKSHRIATRQPTNPSVAVDRASIDVALPDDMTPQMFEAELRARLASHSLSNRFEGDAGRRWTRRRNAWRTRVIEATEIYVFRPREDGRILVAYILDILARHDHRSENARASTDASLQGDAVTPTYKF